MRVAIVFPYLCELVSISNGASVPSCSPSNYIANGGNATQIGFIYDSRNALVSATNSNTNLAEAYDPLERRWTTNDNGYIWSYLHAGDTLMGSNESVFGTWSFMTMPGEGSSLESWYTSGSTVTKYVPLTDADGSVMALVNLANPPQPPATTYSYDPFGMQQVNNGGIWDYPFKYQGAESEPVDWGLYASPGGLYDPYLQQNLGTCPIGLGAPHGLGGSGGGSGGGGGGGIGTPGSGGGFPSPGQLGENAGISAGAGLTAGFAAGALAVEGTGWAVGGPVGGAVALAVDLGLFLDDVFSGGSPTIPRQLMHRSHPIYTQTLGISSDLTPTMESNGGNNLQKQPASPPDPQTVGGGDFVTFTIGGGPIGVGAVGEVTIDKFKNVYVGGGYSFGYSESIVNFSATAGWMKKPPKSEEDLEHFLSGPTEFVGGGYIIGGGAAWNANGVAGEAGIFSPQYGYSKTWACKLPWRL
ncbi:MAG TPA: hypothetical protein VMU16_04790 [Candidatus Binataceae bacterium]|nr:hypothetical protein [Candidatus Binataceae bacterium]